MIHQIFTTPLDYTHGVNVFCFGDLQQGAEGFDEDAWWEFIDEFKSTPNAYALGLGDYQDWLRPTSRGKLQATLAGDTSAAQMLENMIIKDQDHFLNKYMRPLENKCIGIHSGHHEFELLSGGNTSMRLASALKAPYLGWTATTRLRIERKTKNRTGGNSFSYTMLSTHGSGGGRAMAGDIRRLNEMVQWAVCDQVIRGHSCKALNMMPMRRYIVRRNGPAGCDIQIPRCLNVGGFHKGYTDGWKSSYVERAGYIPQPITWGVIRIKVTKRKSARIAKGVINSNTAMIDVENVNRGPGVRAEDLEK